MKKRAIVLRCADISIKIAATTPTKESVLLHLEQEHRRGRPSFNVFVDRTQLEGSDVRPVGSVGIPHLQKVQREGYWDTPQGLFYVTQEEVNRALKSLVYQGFKKQKKA